MIVYVAAALALMVALAGAGYQGFQLGSDAEKAANVAREAAAREAVEAQRQADAEKARRTGAALQAQLAKQKSLNVTLGDSLAKHIAARPKQPPGCLEPVITDGMFNDLNSAIAGAQGYARRGVPSGGRDSAPADRKDAGGADPETR